MIRNLLSFSLSLFITAQAFAEIHWETDMSVAMKKAAEQGKGLLIEFASYDWGDMCREFREEVLDNKEFEEELKDEYICVSLDYPVNKMLPWFLKEQNERLCREYGVEDFPTVIFTDSLGRPYHSIEGNCPMDMVKDDILRARSVREEFRQGMERLKKTKGEDRFQLMGEMMSFVSDNIVKAYYEDFVEEARGLDGYDLSGLRMRVNKDEEEARIGRVMKYLAPKINHAPYNALLELEEYLINAKLSVLGQQLVMLQTAHLLVDLGRPDDAIQRIQKAIDLYPAGERVEKMRGIQRSVKRRREEIIEEAKKAGFSY